MFKIGDRVRVNKDCIKYAPREIREDNELIVTEIEDKIFYKRYTCMHKSGESIVTNSTSIELFKRGNSDYGK